LSKPNPRQILADLYVQGVKGLKIKATFAGYRNKDLVVFSDVQVGNTILTHVHVPVSALRERELKRLSRGDRVLLRADPEVYFSPNHQDGNFTISHVLVKAILKHAKNYKPGGTETYK
jgi:hypothetical protein